MPSAAGSAASARRDPSRGTRISSSRGSGMAASAGADQQHRDLQASHQSVRDASEPGPLQTAPTVGRHHHQVRTYLARVVGECWSRRAREGRGGELHRARCLDPGRDATEVLPLGLSQRQLDLRVQPDAALVDWRRRRTLVHQREPEPRASLPGDGGGPGDRVLGEGRAVEGQEDGAEPEWLGSFGAPRHGARPPSAARKGQYPRRAVPIGKSPTSVI